MTAVFTIVRKDYKDLQDKSLVNERPSKRNEEFSGTISIHVNLT